MANKFFSELAGLPLPDTYFHLGGGGIGGPVVKNRTFFWFSQEGYCSNTTRNGSLRFPTSRERAGDFSQSVRRAGKQVVIYDPLTGDASGNGRQPFPGNVIPAEPHQRGRPRTWSAPTRHPTRDISNGSANSTTRREIDDFAMMYTGKGDHKFSDTVSLTGLLPLQHYGRAVRELLGARLSGPNATTIRATICCPPRADARVEQHVAAEQQHRDYAALRLYTVPRR